MPTGAMIRASRNRAGIDRSVARAAAVALVTLCSGGPTVAEPAYREVVRSSLYVPVRDGTRLAVNIYRPAVDGVAVTDRLPLVFAFTPYRARYVEDGKTIELVDQPTFGLRELVKAGYVVATADVRGKGTSFGARRGFLDRTEAADGAELLEWLAHQPYSTGKAGIVGCSYLGGTAMLVAGARPPSLRAVFAAATDLDKYSFVRAGGLTAQFNTRPDEPLSVDLASVPVDADADGRLRDAAVAEHARNTPMAALWRGMPYRDSVSPLTGNRYWEEVGPYTKLAALRDPRLAWYFWSNWEDEPTAQMILAAANIRSKLVIGPGSHCVPPTEVDVVEAQRRFFDHHLKGIDNGIDREPAYTWVSETRQGNRVVRSDTLPGDGIARSRTYLTAGATGLAAERPRPGSHSFRVDYDVATKDYFAFWPKPLDGKGATYTSAPLRADAAMLGYPVVRLRIVIDKPDANLFAYLEEVDSGGTAKVIAHGRLAASHRKLSPAPYETMGLPYHSGLEADTSPVTPGKPETLVFALSPRAYTFAAGNRLRVRVTGADPRQRDLASFDPAQAPTVTILSGGPDGSSIDIPFVSKSAIK